MARWVTTAPPSANANSLPTWAYSPTRCGWPPRAQSQPIATSSAKLEAFRPPGRQSRPVARPQGGRGTDGGSRLRRFRRSFGSAISLSLILGPVPLGPAFSMSTEGKTRALPVTRPRPCWRSCRSRRSATTALPSFTPFRPFRCGRPPDRSCLRTSATGSRSGRPPNGGSRHEQESRRRTRRHLCADHG